MPRQRFQDPKIQTRSDVSRPFYFIRVFVPVFEPSGLVRRRQNLQLGFTDEMSMRQAKARKQQLLATINAGKFIIQSQVPFREVAQRFMDVHVPTLGSAARERYPIQIRNHILPAFGELQLCEVTQPIVQAWLNGKATEHEEIIKREDGAEITRTVPALSWWTRWDLRGILSGIFNRAREWKLWEGENPCRGVSLGKKRSKRVKQIPTAEDLGRFLEAIPENPLIDQTGAQLIVVTAAVSGLRVSEVLGLCPNDIDPHTKTLRVERRWRRGDEDEPKSEASKRVRQIGSLAGELLAYAASRGVSEYIFVRKDGRPLDDRDLQRDVFRPAAEAVGIYHEGFGMHVFRRLNVTWRQQAGATPIEAQKAAGHASLDMTMLYTQTEEERERQHVETMLGRLRRKKLEGMKAEGGVQ